MKRIKKFTVILLALCMAVFVTACTQRSQITMGVGESYISADAKKYKSSAKYTSSSKSVATVSKKGKVTAKKVGRTTITGTKSGDKYICKVTVKKAVKKVKVNASSITLTPYETYQPKVTFSPKKSATVNLSYKSSDEKVATVSTSGLIRAVGTGNTTITIKTANKKTAKIKVTVVNNQEESL